MQNAAARIEVLNRLKNVKGHVAGIERMVEEDQPCSNVLIQLSAIRASIEKIGIYILENNAVECLAGELTEGSADKQKIEKIIKQILTFLK